MGVHEINEDSQAQRKMLAGWPEQSERSGMHRVVIQDRYQLAVANGR